MFRAGPQAPDIGPVLLTMLRTVAGLRDRAPRPWTEPSVQPVRSGPSAARLRGIPAASACDARSHTCHNPPVVGSSPTRPTYIPSPAETCDLARLASPGNSRRGEHTGNIRAAQDPFPAPLTGAVTRAEAARWACRSGWLYRWLISWLAWPTRRITRSEQMDTAAVEVEEFLSRSVCQLVTSVGWPPRTTPGLTQRPGQRQSRPLRVTTSRAGPRPAQGHNLTKRGWRSRLPNGDSPRMVPPWPACQK